MREVGNGRRNLVERANRRTRPELCEASTGMLSLIATGRTAMTLAFYLRLIAHWIIIFVPDWYVGVIVTLERVKVRSVGEHPDGRSNFGSIPNFDALVLWGPALGNHTTEECGSKQPLHTKYVISGRRQQY